MLFSYSDYISVKDASNLVHIPETMPLDLGAILPCGALAAYSAVQRVKPFIQDKLESTTGATLNKHGSGRSGFISQHVRCVSIEDFAHQMTCPEFVCLVLLCTVFLGGGKAG